jgi:tetratricopeptide (TPR) repeat protein
MRLIFAGLAVAVLASAATPELDKAEALYRQTRYQEALSTVQPLVARDAAALLLAGRAAYGLGDYKKATAFLEQAVARTPNSSSAWHWLGRAFGRRAETAFPLAAPGYASKARQHFEKAVQLDPANAEAVNDLFEYYLQAPGFLGGGLDKAENLLPKIKAIDPAEYEFALAKLGEARKDFQSAEQHLRRAADLAPKSVGRVLDVARFLSRRGRFQESFAWLSRADKMAPKTPQVLFHTAQTYIEAKQNLPAARALLESYLRAELTPDLPSREEARKLLKQASGG